MRQWFQVKDGKYTIARMDQDGGKYQILIGMCESAEGPYIHHMAEIEGDYTEEIKEFCKYIPGLELDTVEKE